jgi:hypothetical protein
VPTDSRRGGHQAASAAPRDDSAEAGGQGGGATNGGFGDGGLAMTTQGSRVDVKFESPIKIEAWLGVRLE